MTLRTLWIDQLFWSGLAIGVAVFVFVLNRDSIGRNDLDLILMGFFLIFQLGLSTGAATRKIDFELRQLRERIEKLERQSPSITNV